MYSSFFQYIQGSINQHIQIFILLYIYNNGLHLRSAFRDPQSAYVDLYNLRLDKKLEYIPDIYNVNCAIINMI